MKLLKILLTTCCLSGLVLPSAAATKKTVCTSAYKAVTAEVPALPTTLSRGMSTHDLLILTRAFKKSHGGRLPRKALYNRRDAISTIDMNDEQLFEVRLARQVYFRLTQEKGDPKGELAMLADLYKRPAPAHPKPSAEKFLVLLEKWIEQHQGLRPRPHIYRNGKHLGLEDLQKEPELYEEQMLARWFTSFLNQNIPDKRVRDRLAEIAELPTFSRAENSGKSYFYDGFGRALPTQHKFVEQLQAWVDAHNSRRPRLSIYHNKKYTPVSELNEVEHEEYLLACRLSLLLNKGKLDKSVLQRLQNINRLPVWNPDK